MKRIVITSIRESAGKTSMILGIAAGRQEKIGYMKPFGDRLIYRRKRNWDYDASVMVQILGQDDEPEAISLGFNHSKLRYVHDEEGTRSTVVEMSKNVGRGKELLLVEGGKSLSYGASVYLDAISIARYLDASLVVVTSGDNDTVFDDITFLRKNLPLEGVDFGGVIANKLPDVDDFENAVMPEISKMGVRMLGAVPFKEQLTRFTVKFLAERLLARVIAGEEGLEKTVRHIFVGAMSTEETMRAPVLNKENKLLITSGDRSDMILAALESDTIGILLTNNLLPPAKIISMASEKKIPILLAAHDTFQVARQIEALEALPTAEDHGNKEVLTNLVKKYVRTDEVLS